MIEASGHPHVDDDETLVTRAQRGDRAALETLLSRHAATAACAAYAVLGRHDEALDAAQSALLRVVQGIASGKWAGGSVRAWVCACAHAAAVDLVRADASRKRTRDRAAEEAAVAGTEVDAPEALIERAENCAALREELANLQETTSQALALHHLHGLPVALVAHQLGLTLDACKQRLSRGRDELRQRLARRGITLTGVAWLPDVLAALGRVADTWTANLPASTLSRLADLAAQSAVASAATIAQTTSSGPSTASQGVRSQDGLRPSNGGSSEMSTTSHDTHTAGSTAWGSAVAAVVVLAAIGYVLFFGGPQPSTATLNSPVATTTSTEAETAEPAAGPATDTSAAAPRWQHPRFVQGSHTPLSVAVNGRFVAILTAAPRTVGHMPPLVLIESVDGGATWRKTESFERYENGSVALDEQGNCAITGVVTRLPKAMIEASGAEALKARQEKPKPLSIEWRLRRVGSTFSPPEVIWQTEADSGEYLALPEVHLTGGRVWAFALLAKPRTLMRHVAAYSESLAAPKPLKVWSGGGENCAWADGKNAGLVCATRSGMQHFATTDAGETWEPTAIPFAPEEGSDQEDIMVTPMMLRRNESRLALTVMSHQRPRGETNIMKYTQTNYLLLSDDLGKTWQPRIRVSQPVSLMEELQGLPQVALWGDQVALGMTSREGFDAVWNTKDGKREDRGEWATVMFTGDQGDSWFNQRVLDALGKDVTGLCFGSDGKALHVVLFKRRSETDGSLVIRSFAPGRWAAPASKPDWFKEAALPDPVQEEF